MENFFQPPTTTTTTTATTSNTATTAFLNLNHEEQPMIEQNVRSSNMGCSPSFQFSINESQSFPSTSSTSHSQFHHPTPYQQPHDHSLQFPYAFPSEHVDPSVYPTYPFRVDTGAPNSILRGYPDGVLSDGHAQKIWNSRMTKAARSNRMLARQRSASLNRSSSGASSSSSLPSSSRVCTRLTTYDPARAAQNSTNSDLNGLYTFCTPDNKKLRVLLKKELKNSDVGSLGRIVLPKREAEANLPCLSEKEGIQVAIRDVYSNQVWYMQYKFWSNNKSRMYLLENTGDFIKRNRLEIGDSFTLYDDESKNLYVSIEKVAEPATETSNTQQNDNYNNYIVSPITNEARDEEDTSLAILIEELTQKEQQEANQLTLLMDIGASPYRKCEETKNNGSSSIVTDTDTSTQLATATATTTMEPSSSSKRKSDNQTEDFDDCFGNLGTLPNISRYL